MARSIKVCKICGKEYEYCRTERKSNVFRWQDVACCFEHGSQYFADVERARGVSTNNETIPAKKTVGKTRSKSVKNTSKDGNPLETVLHDQM